MNIQLASLILQLRKMLPLVYDHRIRTCTACSLTDCEDLGKLHTWNVQALGVFVSMLTPVTGCCNVNILLPTIVNDMYVVMLRS